MLFLFYFIIGSAALANFFFSNPNYSIIRTNFDIKNHDIYEKHNQLEASKRILQDSIKHYERWSNLIVGKKIIKENNEIYSGNSKNLNVENYENRDEIIDENFVSIKNALAISLDNKKLENEVKIKEKRSIEDHHNQLYEKKDEKEILLVYPNGIHEKIIIKDDNSTLDNSIKKHSTVKIAPKNKENYKKEITTPSYFRRNNYLYHLLKKESDDYLSIFLNLEDNFDTKKSTEYIKNTIIFQKKGSNNLKFLSIFLDLDFILNEMKFQIKIDNSFYGFDNLCLYISKFLEKDAVFDSETICTSIPKIYEYFKSFYGKIVNLDENMGFLLDNFYNKLYKYIEHDTNLNHLNEFDKLIRDLGDIKITIEEKFKKVYIKKNKIRNSICESYINQYGIEHDNFNVPNICLERYICTLDLDFKKNPKDVKDSNVKLKNARKNVNSCLKKEEKQQNNPLISLNIDKYRNNTNFESIIKNCVSKNIKRKIPTTKSKSMYNEILSSTLFFNMNEFNYVDLAFYEIVLNERIEELITRLSILNLKFAKKTTSSK